MCRKKIKLLVHLIIFAQKTTSNGHRPFKQLSQFFLNIIFNLYNNFYISIKTQINLPTSFFNMCDVNL